MMGNGGTSTVHVIVNGNKCLKNSLLRFRFESWIFAFINIESKMIDSNDL
jgi:hypothetical protein